MGGSSSKDCDKERPTKEVKSSINADISPRHRDVAAVQRSSSPSVVKYTKSFAESRSGVTTGNAPVKVTSEGARGSDVTSNASSSSSIASRNDVTSVRKPLSPSRDVPVQSRIGTASSQSGWRPRASNTAGNTAKELKLVENAPTSSSSDSTHVELAQSEVKEVKFSSKSAAQKSTKSISDLSSGVSSCDTLFKVPVRIRSKASAQPAHRLVALNTAPHTTKVQKLVEATPDSSSSHGKYFDHSLISAEAAAASVFDPRHDAKKVKLPPKPAAKKYSKSVSDLTSTIKSWDGLYEVPSDRPEGSTVIPRASIGNSKASQKDVTSVLKAAMPLRPARDVPVSVRSKASTKPILRLGPSSTASQEHQTLDNTLSSTCDVKKIKLSPKSAAQTSTKSISDLNSGKNGGDALLKVPYDGARGSFVTSHTSSGASKAASNTEELQLKAQPIVPNIPVTNSSNAKILRQSQTSVEYAVDPLMDPEYNINEAPVSKPRRRRKSNPNTTEVLADLTIVNADGAPSEVPGMMLLAFCHDTCASSDYDSKTKLDIATRKVETDDLPVQQLAFDLHSKRQNSGNTINGASPSPKTHGQSLNDCHIYGSGIEKRSPVSSLVSSKALSDSKFDIRQWNMAWAAAGSDISFEKNDSKSNLEKGPSCSVASDIDVEKTQGTLPSVPSSAKEAIQTARSVDSAFFAESSSVENAENYFEQFLPSSSDTAIHVNLSGKSSSIWYEEEEDEEHCPMPLCSCNDPAFKNAAGSDVICTNFTIANPRRTKEFVTPCGDSPKTKQYNNEVIVEIDVKVAEDAVEGFIKYLQSEKTSFAVLKVIYTSSDDSGKKSTWILIRFPSKKQAKSFIADVKRCDHDPPVKVSYRNEDDLSRTETEAQEKQLWAKIAENIQTPLLDNGKKVKRLLKELEEKKLKSRQSLHIDLQCKLSDERKALSAKIEELENAKKVFLSFMNELKSELSSASKTANMAQSIKNIEQKFAIEKQRFQTSLPMYGRKNDIINTIKENQVCILLGETGSGKSTQMVQYLQQAGLAAKGKIVCTQPRKIAAVNLAQRVAQEMNSSVGQIVGYEVGMQTKQCSVTSIVYVTDHMLLRKCVQDPLFEDYGCIVIDEAHERSLHTDLLLGMIKKCLPKRPDLRVIITSATIDPDVFVRYFNGCPVLKVSGRTFPVDVFHSSYVRGEDYVSEAVTKAIDVHLDEPIPGDILVFLTSGQETERAEQLMKSKLSDKSKVIILQLHGKMQPADQRKVFEETPIGKRKVVFATNCAETSLTIDGIKYIVDTGMVKAASFDHTRNMNILKEQSIAQSSAEQRKGRAGRTQSGKCFRIYTKDQFESMEKETPPEIMRTHLGMGLLQLLVLGVCDYFEFDFVQSPPKKALDNAMSELEELGACKGGKLTELGMKMSKLSVEPRLAKLILLGIEYHIGNECLIIAAFGTIPGSAFYRAGTPAEKEMADRKKLRFCEDRGDLLTLLTVFKEWFCIPEKQKSAWCFKNSINGKAMKMARDTIKELTNTLTKELRIKVHLKFSENKDSVEKIVCIILNCYARNLSFFSGHSKCGYYLASEPDVNLHLHPSSALQCCEDMPKWMVYTSVLNTSKSFMLNATAIDDQWILHMVKTNQLPVNLDILEGQSLEKRNIPGVGPQTMRKLAGPRFAHIKAIEEEMGSLFESKVVVDASFERVSLDVYTHKSKCFSAEQYVGQKVDDVKKTLIEETAEIALSSGSSIRPVVKCGADICEIFFPGEFKNVVIRNVSERYDVNDVKDMLQDYGRVSDIIKFNAKTPKTPWGKATFSNQSDAKKCVENGMDFPFSVKPDHIGFQPSEETEYRLRLQWVRRPLKGCAFIGVSNVSATEFVEQFTQITFPSSTQTATMQLNRKMPGELYVRNIDRSLTDKEVRDVIERKLQNAFADVQITKLVLPKEPAGQTSNSDIGMYSRRIGAILQENGIGQDQVTITVLKPEGNTAYFTAFINFREASIGERAEHYLQDATINGKSFQISGHLQLSVRVPKDIHDCVKTAIKNVIKDCEKQKGQDVNITKKELRFGDIHYSISAGRPDDAMSVQRQLVKIRNGKCIEMHPDRFYQLRAEKGFLTSIQRRWKILAKLDARLFSVVLYGLEKSVTRAEGDIRHFIKERESCLTQAINLKGDAIPKGFMKKLVRKYGADFSELKRATGVKAIDLKIRDHLLIGVGSSETLSSLKCLITSSYISDGEHTEDMPQSAEECPICFCDIESDFVLLETCGHKYCKACFKSLIDNAIETKEVPIECASENCGMPVALCDIRKVVGPSEGDLRPLMLASLDVYISKNKRRFKPCKTPDCLGLYRVTRRAEKFKCPECNCRSICTRCHGDYHVGMTCAQTESMQNDPDYNLKDWISEDPANRSRCPKCDMPIEKTAGCNHMHCLACKTHICWVCKKVFKSSSDCYGHLNREHGSFV